MNKKWLVSMVSAGAVALSASAFAQQSATQGFYVGAEAGWYPGLTLSIGGGVAIGILILLVAATD